MSYEGITLERQGLKMVRTAEELKSYMLEWANTRITECAAQERMAVTQKAKAGLAQRILTYQLMVVHLHSIHTGGA